MLLRAVLALTSTAIFMVSMSFREPGVAAHSSEFLKVKLRSPERPQASVRWSANLWGRQDL
jgi:hypothetical protein